MIVLISSCEKGHLTETELLSPTVLEDGSVEGYTGSDAEFCPVCDSSKMVAMDTIEKEGVYK